MKKPQVSIVMPIYKPEKEVLEKIRDMLKKQTIKAEVVENWNMPEAKSTNTGIKKARGEVVVTLSADCVPENEFWLEKLIKPLENKEVSATISDLHLPEEYWKKYPFLTRIFTLSDRKDKKNGLDARACAYRKKDLMDVGLFDEDPKVIGIDVDLAVKLETKGKFVRPNIKVLHLHKSENFRDVIKKMYIYSEGNGKAVRQFNEKLGKRGLWIRIVKAIPFLGMALSFIRYPYKKYFHLFPLYLILVVPSIHILTLAGFWKGFFMDKESVRNILPIKTD